MSKNNGFASFTPAQSEQFIREEHHNKPQKFIAGRQRHVQRQRPMNRQG